VPENERAPPKHGGRRHSQRRRLPRDQGIVVPPAHMASAGLEPP